MFLNLIVLVHVFATLMMTGVIWFVQVVHYPLFARVGSEVFTLYEADHTRLTTFVVMPLMLLEISTAFLLIFLRPVQIPMWQVIIGFGLVLIIWLSTFFLQVPQHNILGAGFNDAAHRFLVGSNWLRTAAWSLRSLLVLWMVALLMDSTVAS